MVKVVSWDFPWIGWYLESHSVTQNEMVLRFLSSIHTSGICLTFKKSARNECDEGNPNRQMLNDRRAQRLREAWLLRLVAGWEKW